MRPSRGLRDGGNLLARAQIFLADLKKFESEADSTPVVTVSPRRPIVAVGLMLRVAVNVVGLVTTILPALLASLVLSRAASLF